MESQLYIPPVTRHRIHEFKDHVRRTSDDKRQKARKARRQISIYEPPVRRYWIQSDDGANLATEAGERVQRDEIRST